MTYNLFFYRTYTTHINLPLYLVGFAHSATTATSGLRPPSESGTVNSKETYRRNIAREIEDTVHGYRFQISFENFLIFLNCLIFEISPIFLISLVYTLGYPIGYF